MAKSEVEEIYDRYAKEYSGNFAPMKFSTSRVAFKFADAITWHFIAKHLPKKKSTHMLDAGGGGGWWSEKLLSLGYTNITLTDLSEKMLAQARKKLAKHGKMVRFIKSDISDMKELEDNSFGFVFSQYDPVGYCMKPKQAVAELARVARKGAFISVMVDTKYRRVPEFIEAGQIGEAERLLKTGISDDYFHPQVNFTWESLSGCFTAAGLEVKEVIGAPVFMHQVNQKVLKKLLRKKGAWQELMKIELENCTDRSLVNFAGHLQIVGRKR